MTPRDWISWAVEDPPTCLEREKAAANTRVAASSEAAPLAAGAEPTPIRKRRRWPHDRGHAA